MAVTGVKAAKVKTKTLRVGSRQTRANTGELCERLTGSRLGFQFSGSSEKCPPSTVSRGFTLIEVLVVLVLLAALTAVAAPSIGRGFGAIELQTTARKIASTLRQARMKAVREQQAFVVGFDLEKNEVELTREDLSFRRTFELPESVTITKVARKGQEPISETWVTCLFVPNGLSESFEVWLRNKRGRELKVVQDSFLKSPRIEDVEDAVAGSL